MKHVLKLFGTFLVITLLNYAQEINISGAYYPNTPINLRAETEGFWKIAGKPIYSDAKLVQNGMTAIFTADTVGEFELSFTSGTDNQAEKIIKKIKIVKFNQFNEQFDEKQIYDIIVESFSSKNYILFKYGLNNLKVNYPTSEYLHRAYIKALELCMEQLNYEDGRKYLEILLFNYKYTEEEKIKYLKLAYEFFDFFDKNIEKLKYLVQLAEYDDMYKEILGKMYIAKNLTEKEGVAILEKLYKKSFSKKLAVFLGDYYLKKGNEGRAIEYYGNSDKVALAKLMLKRLSDEEYAKLIKDFTEEELSELTAYQEEKTDLQKMENYYKYAKNNIEKDRLELAEIYLNRIVNQKLNNSLKKEAAEKLIELYVIQERYLQAIDVYTLYLDDNMDLKDVKNLYNKGLIYTKLNQTGKSLEIFNEITEKYPDTIWARKAQISIFKINNRNKNNL